MPYKRLFRFSLILFVGSMVVNFGNYLFNLITGRLLGPELYGVLIALTSLFYIFAVPASAINTVTSNFTSGARDDSSLIYSFWWRLSMFLLRLSFVVVVFLIFLSPTIANFLKIPSAFPVILTSICSLLFLITPVNKGLIWGMKKISNLSIVNIIEVFSKIFFAVVFILIGFSVSGAILGFFFGAFVAYLYSFIPIREIFKERKLKNINLRETKDYSVAVLLAFLFITAIYNVDIILVKHFFDAFTAGIYSSVSVIGKIIFFSSTAIAGAMFPITSELNGEGNGSGHKKIFWNSFLMVCALSLTALSVFFFFPKEVTRILFGSAFMNASQYVSLFGIFSALLSIVNLFVYYFVSIHYKKFLYFLGPVLFTEIAAISFFHSSLNQVISILIILMAVLSSIFFYQFKTIKE